MSKEIPKDKLEKIKKLLRWADSKKKSEDAVDIAQAEAATLQARKMMAEYNLAMSDVSIKEEDREKVDSTILDPHELNAKNEGTWIISLYHVIARHNYCRAINRDEYFTDIYKDEWDKMSKERSKHKNGSPKWLDANYAIYKRFYTGRWKDKTMRGVRLIGEPSNIEMVKYIVEQLVSRVRMFAKEAYKSYSGEEKKNAFYRGYFQGFVRGIDDKLSKQKVVIEKNKQLQSMALVKTNQIEKWVSDNISLGKGGNGNAGRTSAIGGKVMGYAKGLKTDIHKGVQTSQLNQKMIG